MENIDDLKNKFIEAAIVYGEKAVNGNYKLANKKADFLIETARILRISEEGKDALKKLLQHENPSVQLWAAANCLPFYTDKSINVLNQIKRRDDFIGTSAGVTLDEWKEGKLKFD